MVNVETTTRVCLRYIFPAIVAFGIACGVAIVYGQLMGDN